MKKNEFACRVCGSMVGLQPDPADYVRHADDDEGGSFLHSHYSWTPREDALHVLAGESTMSTNGATKADLHRVIGRLQQENIDLQRGNTMLRMGEEVAKRQSRINRALDELNRAQAALEANGEPWFILERIREAIAE